MCKEIQCKNSAGFTLIDLMVSLLIFGIVVSATTSIFIRGIRAQRRVLALQLVQENARYVIELMTKEIRMSHIEDDSAQDSLHITAYKSAEGSEDVVYALSNGRILRNGIPITSQKVNVDKLKFYITNLNNPPAITTIAMVIKTEGEGIEQQAEINLQTTISARDFLEE